MSKYVTFIYIIYFSIWRYKNSNKQKKNKKWTYFKSFKKRKNVMRLANLHHLLFKLPWEYAKLKFLLRLVGDLYLKLQTKILRH